MDAARAAIGRIAPFTPEVAGNTPRETGQIGWNERGSMNHRLATLRINTT
jgi:hypothetical protein